MPPERKITFDREKEKDLFDYLLIILKQWKVILVLFAVAVTATAIISLNITPRYKAQTSILPISSETAILNIVTSSGLPLYGGNEANTQKILAILNSRTIRQNVINKLNIFDVLLEDWPEKRRSPNIATGILSTMVKITSNVKTGLITISVEHKNPELSKDIANQYVTELELILREKSFTVIKMYRLFIEDKLKSEEQRLKGYQEEMANFQKESKMIEPTTQLKGTIDIYSNLVSQKIDLEIELNKIESALSERNPRVVALKKQLEAIDKQILKIEENQQAGALTSFINAPDQLIVYSELLRKINTSQALYDTFSEMYEKARFEEIKESLYVEVIDPAITPAWPFKPNKRKMVVIAGIIAILTGIFYSFVLNAITKKINADNKKV